MEIKETKIKVRDLAKDFVDDPDKGVWAYGGKLNVRPPYQREFVYNDKQQQAVIVTVQKNFPLNIMYWAVQDDGTFEVIDGQQRTISICKYVANLFSCGDVFLDNLTKEGKEQILDYELTIYLCKGTDKEKMDWFQVINIAGKELTKQELRNAVYHSPWLSSAKRYFSKPGCPAQTKYKDYLAGNSIEQAYLETVLRWRSCKLKNVDDKIAAYMGEQAIKEKDATALWAYFEEVMDWVKETFPTYNSVMKGIEWGILYDQFKDKGGKTNSEALEKEVARLMADYDVGKKAGIYWYVFDHRETYLNIREFDARTKQTIYAKQTKQAKAKGVSNCPHCAKSNDPERKTKIYELAEMDADHIKPWSKGGQTIAENCQMLCRKCNEAKSNH